LGFLFINIQFQNSLPPIFQIKNIIPYDGERIIFPSLGALKEKYYSLGKNIFVKIKSPRTLLLGAKEP
jgi:hypothetical protein